MIAALLALQLANADVSSHGLLPADEAKCRAALAEHPVSEAVAARRLLTTVAPRMPVHDMKSGCAVLTFRIAADGSVSDVQAVHATRRYHAISAERAVREWRYAPGTVGAGATIVVFTLSGE